MRKKANYLAALPIVAGRNFGGWKALRPVDVLKTYITGPGTNSQAISLNGYARMIRPSTGQPGSVEQNVSIQKHQEVIVSFKA
ncbi:MAG: hypothetical protein H7240_07075 [Glaciimonas sp.]|nr:hypothetical protein [Glaciimonas sp.]